MIHLDGEQGGEIDLGGQLHVGHFPRQRVGIEGAGQLGVNPAGDIALTLFGQVLLNLLALGPVDMAIGPGCCHHGAHQKRRAGIQRIAFQPTDGMGGLGRCRLLGLPILIELVGQPAKGCGAAHGSGLATIFAHFFIAQQ